MTTQPKVIRVEIVKPGPARYAHIYHADNRYMSVRLDHTDAKQALRESADELRQKAKLLIERAELIEQAIDFV